MKRCRCANFAQKNDFFLFQVLVKNLKLKLYRKATLRVLKSNKIAFNLYKKLGFQVEEETKEFLIISPCGFLSLYTILNGIFIILLILAVRADAPISGDINTIFVKSF